MFVARDTEGMLIWADEANKQTDYFCPVCSGKLILRAGEVNAHHFAHEAGACPDHWHYDIDLFRTTIEMMRKRLAKEPQQQFLRVVDRHRGFLAPCPKGKANGGMRTYGCRDCESFICSMTCVSGGSSGVYCAYPAQANTYGDWDTDYRV